MGEGSKRIAVSGRRSENKGLHSCETHYLLSRQEEDRGGAAGTLGEAEGWEEGSVKSGARMKPATSVAGFLFGEESLRLECQMS
jgi:hypothetical protein